MKQKYVLVRFMNNDGQTAGKKYSYLTDIDLKNQDWVIVYANDVFVAVLVVQTEAISKSDRDKANKWIVQRVDYEAFAEKTLVRTKIEAIKQRLHERKEEAEELMLYKMLAATDPEIRVLLEELNDIAPDMIPMEDNAKQAQVEKVSANKDAFK